MSLTSFSGAEARGKKADPIKNDPFTNACLIHFDA